MRLLILQDWLRNGGTERQSLFLAQWMGEQHHEVTLLTFRPGGVLAPPPSLKGVRHVALQKRDWHLNFFSPALIPTLASLKPDLLLCMGRMANAKAAHIRQHLPHLPLVCTVRTGKPLPASNLRGARVADAVIVNAAWWQQALARQHIPAERLHTIPNAYFRTWDTPTLQKARPGMRQALGVPDNACVFLNVSGFRAGKNHDHLLQALAALPPDAPPWRLWLVGDGPCLAPSRRLSQRLGIAHLVHFAGYRQEPLQYFAGSDLALSASTEDALPNFLVEAQWCGLPVIARDYRGVCECFEHGHSGLLTPPSPLAPLTQAAERLLRDPRLRESMSLAAARRARQHYAPDTSAQAHLQLFMALAEKTIAR